MRRDVFIETYHVLALRAAVESALEAGLGSPAMVMAYGEAGTGKTEAARSLYVEQGGMYLRAFEGVTQAAFLQDICNECGGGRPHGSTRCRAAIMDRLGDAPRAIFVDEADRLHVSRLEDLRDIHDMTGSPIILIGEMGLPTRVNARSRINDRIPEAFRVHFSVISSADIAQFARETASLQLSPEATEFVRKETKGNFRRVHNAVLLLERAANANGCSDIDADFARAALAPKKAGARR